MREGETEKQIKMLQREIALAGEELEALKRRQREERNALRLEVEALRRCLERLHPGFEGCFDSVRTEVMQETDPEEL